MSASFWNGILADHAAANTAPDWLKDQTDRLIFENASARGYMESCIRSAVIQLEQGQQELALGTLRRALARAGA